MKTNKPLTPKQQSFVINYIKNGFNGYQAMVDAGYSHTVARVKVTSMLDNPNIKQRLAKAYQKVEARHELMLCMSIQDKAKILTQIIYDIVPQDGSEPKRDYYKDALKAINELNKMQGDYAPDKRLNVTVDATKERLLEARRQYEEF